MSSLYCATTPAFIISTIFNYGQSDWSVMISHSGDDLHFYNNDRIQVCGMYMLAFCMSSLKKYLLGF